MLNFFDLPVRWLEKIKDIPPTRCFFMVISTMLTQIRQNNHHLKNKSKTLGGGWNRTVPIQTTGRVPWRHRSLRKLRPMRKLQLAAKVSVAAEAKAPCTKPRVVAAGGNQGATKRGGFLNKEVFSEKAKWKEIQNFCGVKRGEILCFFLGEGF